MPELHFPTTRRHGATEETHMGAGTDHDRPELRLADTEVLAIRRAGFLGGAAPAGMGFSVVQPTDSRADRLCGDHRVVAHERCIVDIRPDRPVPGLAIVPDEYLRR